MTRKEKIDLFFSVEEAEAYSKLYYLYFQLRCQLSGQSFKSIDYSSIEEIALMNEYGRKLRAGLNEILDNNIYEEYLAWRKSVLRSETIK